MIHSKIIMSTLSYKINNVTNKNYNTLLDIMAQMLNNKELNNKVKIIDIDNNIDATIQDDVLDVIVTTYLTTTRINSVIKDIRVYIDNNLAHVTTEDFEATLIKRRVY